MVIVENFMAQLNEVDTDGVEPMTTVLSGSSMKMRKDVVTDEGNVSDILANVPSSANHYFAVPKMVD